MLCFRSCPVSAISGSKKEIHYIDTDKCIKCGTCIELCSNTYNAIERVHKY
jgi:NADH-quinone oxidoreductase subunit F